MDDQVFLRLLDRNDEVLGYATSIDKAIPLANRMLIIKADFLAILSGTVVAVLAIIDYEVVIVDLQRVFPITIGHSLTIENLEFELPESLAWGESAET